jgi:hypothetical protein
MDTAVQVVESFVVMAHAYSKYMEVRSRPKPWSDLLRNEYRPPIGTDNLIGAICGTFYWRPIAEHGITEIPKRAPELIERLRKSVDSDIARLARESIPKAILRDTEFEPEDSVA